MLHALRVGLVIATTASFIANMDVTVANDVGGALDPLHLPIVAPANELWPYPSARAPNLYLGDLRAKIQVSKVGTVTGTLWWRRRDPNFLTKSVAVTDANGTWVENVRVLSSSADCGIIEFSPTKVGVYYVYWLAHFQSGGGANLHFHWFNCTSRIGRAC